MRTVTAAIAAGLCSLSLSQAVAEPPLQVPQSIRLQHEQIISRLDHFAHSNDTSLPRNGRRRS